MYLPLSGEDKVSVVYVCSLEARVFKGCFSFSVTGDWLNGGASNGTFEVVFMGEVNLAEILVHSSRSIRPKGVRSGLIGRLQQQY
jgi:hypothetical protein